MAPLSPLTPALLGSSALRLGESTPGLPPGAAALPDSLRSAPAGTTDGFGQLLDGLVATVNAKDTAATALTRRVLLGESDQLHQSVIAMQEVSVAFGLMVEVRNKLVDSYQELMRMQV